MDICIFHCYAGFCFGTVPGFYPIALQPDGRGERYIPPQDESHLSASAQHRSERIDYRIAVLRLVYDFDVPLFAAPHTLNIASMNIFITAIYYI